MRKKMIFLCCSIFFTIALFSCKKDGKKNNFGENNTPQLKNYSYGQHNDDLLNYMTSMVSVSNGMLRFSSKVAFDAYLLSIEEFLDSWDYSEADDTIVGDEALNALDNVLGFSSLRYFQELQYEANGPDVIFDIDVPSYTLSSVLNDRYEIWIGDKIYRYINNDFMVEISNNGIDVLGLLDNYGILTENDNIQFLNLKDGEITRHPYGEGGPKSSNSSTCQFKAVYPDKFTSTDRQRTFTVSLENVDGNGNFIGPVTLVNFELKITEIGGGGYNSTENWSGIGFSTKGHLFPNHLPLVALRSYKIAISGTVISPSENCPPGTKKIWPEFTIHVENPAVATCISGNKSRTVGKVFQFGGSEYNVTGCVWQERNFFWEGCGAKTRFYKKINGNFVGRKPDLALNTQVYGYYFTQSCQNMSPYKSSHKNKKAKVLEATFTTPVNTQFGTFNDADNPAESLWGAFNAVMTGYTIMAAPSVDIHP